MKRFFFSLIALTAVAAGCTQSEMLEAPDLGGTEITFSPYTGRTPVTKAASIETPAGLANANASAEAKADPNGFYVYSFLNQTIGDTQTTSVYLDNKKVYSPSKGQTANDWTYDGLVYWPTSEGSSLDFVAYSANGVGNFVDSEGNSTDSEGKPIQASSTGFTFKVPNTIDQQVDLLATAYQAGNTLSGGASVTLQFHHLLSRVGFQVQTTTDTEVEITGLTLTGTMPTQGTLDFSAANTSVNPSAIPSLVATNEETKTYNCITGNTTATTSGTVPGTEYLMIMPHIADAVYEGNTDNLLGSDHYIDVTYTIDGSSKVRTSRVTLPIGFEFVQGYAYEIILKISTSSLSFVVEQEPWGTENTTIEPGNPPTPGEEPEEEEPVVYTDEAVEYESATLSLLYVAHNEVSLRMNMKSGYYADAVDSAGDVEPDDKNLAIAYRKVDASSWTHLLDIDSASNGQTFDSQFDVEPSTEYECCIYFESKETWTKKRWLLGYYVEYGGHKTAFYGQEDLINNDTGAEGPDGNADDAAAKYIRFFTHADITYPSLVLSGIADDDIVLQEDNLCDVTLGAQCTKGIIDGEIIEISEYGFCWVKGTEAPTILDAKVSWSASENESSYEMNHIIENLKPNTTYSYCAYCIPSVSTEAYVCTEASPLLPQLTTITEAGEPIYTHVGTFTTRAIIDDGDDAGGSWDDGGSADM